MARFHQVGEVLCAEEVLDEAGGLVPGFAVPALRGTAEDPVAGLAAVSAPGASAAAAEGDGVSRATAALAAFGAEPPGSGDDLANALGAAAAGCLVNRLDQQPTVGGPTSAMNSGTTMAYKGYTGRIALRLDLNEQLGTPYPWSAQRNGEPVVQGKRQNTDWSAPRSVRSDDPVLHP